MKLFVGSPMRHVPYLLHAAVQIAPDRAAADYPQFLFVQQMRERWQVEDREFNAVTVRAHRRDKLHAEIFKFSLAPTTSNESKPLNLLVVEEAHLADDTERSYELDPMHDPGVSMTKHRVTASPVRVYDPCHDDKLPHGEMHPAILRGRQDEDNWSEF